MCIRDRAEEAQYLFGGWMSAQTLLGIKREFPDSFPIHGHPKFALYQGLNEQGQEVQREKGLDPGLVLEEDRRDFVHGLDPVSYTHLDVYKRQTQHRRAAISGGLQGQRRGGGNHGYAS